MPIILLKVLLLSLFAVLIGCLPPAVVNSSGRTSSNNSTADPITLTDLAKPDDKAAPQPLPQVTLKCELISEINTKLALESSDIDKFKNLNQEELREVFHELNKKAPDYKKAFMQKIVSTNNLSPFIKNNQLDDEFINSLKTQDEDNYSFSNSLLEAALNDNNVSDEVKKEVVKKVFELGHNEAGSKFLSPKYRTKLGNTAIILLDDIALINKEFPYPVDQDRKDQIADKLKKIFALGDEAIKKFYDYIISYVCINTNSTLMCDPIAQAIITLILEKDLLKQIIKTEAHAYRLTYVIADWTLSHRFALKIRDKILNNKNDYDEKIIKFILEEFYKRAKDNEKYHFKL